jgi:predicted lactoylglutathione lyase
MNRPELKKIWIEHFKEDTTSLAYDTVPNVRIKLAYILKVHFKQIVGGSFVDDKQLNQVIAHLSQDSEEDVRNIISLINN